MTEKDRKGKGMSVNTCYHPITLLYQSIMDEILWIIAILRRFKI